MSDTSQQHAREAGLGSDAFDGLVRTLAKAVTYLYVGWLSLSIPLRTALKSFSSVTLLLASLAFLVELAVVVINPAESMIHLPVWVEVVVLLLAGLMVRHRIHELRGLRRKPVLLWNVKSLLRQVVSLDFNSLSEQKKTALLHRFIFTVLIRSRRVFEDTGRLQLNVMLLEPSDGRLHIRHKLPTNARYTRLPFVPNEGAAGVAFSTGKMVYVPSIRFRHGIVVDIPELPESAKRRRRISYRLKDSVYHPTRPESYKAVLSVPIKSSTGRVLGVLNLDVPRTNPFTEFDFQAAEVVASFLAMALERYKANR